MGALGETGGYSYESVHSPPCFLVSRGSKKVLPVVHMRQQLDHDRFSCASVNSSCTREIFSIISSAKYHEAAYSDICDLESPKIIEFQQRYILAFNYV